MELMQHLVERLRPILGSKRWDYCVLWKLSEDGRFVEWVDCCCGGSTHGVEDDQEKLVIPFSCKDAIIQHPRTKSCDLLAQLPSSIPFDSGIHAQTMISNQARWLNFADNSVSGIFDVSEDQGIIDLVASQFNISMEQYCINFNKNSNVNSTFIMDDQNNPNNYNIQPPISSQTMLENLNFSQFNYTGNVNNKNVFFNGGDESYSLNGINQETVAIQRQMIMSDNMGGGTLETKKRKSGVPKDVRILNRSDSLSDADYSALNDADDDEPKPRRRKGKGPSKNLVAERNRRKKLNDRLYALRALVPKISKLDRASILGDATEHVMELQRQVEDLQNELQEHLDDDEGDTNNCSTITQQDFRPGKNPKSACVMFSNGSLVKGSMKVGIIKELKNPYDHENQQMEPQMEVHQLEAGNEFLVKVFCEHKNGGFVKLMEAFTSLGLDVTNVDVTSFRSLVMNVFKVEDSEMVEAEHVRISSLETETSAKSVARINNTTIGYENDRGGDHHIHEYATPLTTILTTFIIKQL